jgi:phosphoribosylformylglycinamidine cyclo-ligase
MTSDEPGRPDTAASHYRAAGVDLAAADAAKDRIAAAVRGTRTPLVIGEVGAFGGMVGLPDDLQDPALVMSTDGVGTKVMVALASNRYDTVGEDLVNHSVNDVLVHGAQPLAFMDYIAGAALSVETIAAIVEGIARGCRAHRMALSGGETAQMPGLYQPGHFDLAGTIIGVADKSRILHGAAITPGDALLGYASTGLHTNGYTLARRVLLEDMGLGLDDAMPRGEGSVADTLLAVHRSYFDAVWPVLHAMHGMAHITGGGIAGNLVRVLPEQARAHIASEAWPMPPLFEVLQEGGAIDTEEMREVFNLGIGFVAVLPVDRVQAAQDEAQRAGVETWIIGDIRAGERGVSFD